MNTRTAIAMFMDSLLIRRMRRTFLALGLVATTGVAYVLGQGAEQVSQTPRPTFRAGVNYVEVDVTVTDPKGEFVRGLTREAFEVLEDGKPQKVSAFTLIDLPVAEAGPASSSLPPATRLEPDIRSNTATSAGRVFIIVLDDLHTDPIRSTRVREAIRLFIDRYLGPEDLVSVIHTSGVSDASQEFTDRQSLLLASVDKFVGSKLRSTILERLDEYQRTRENNTGADIRLQTVSDPLDTERARRAENLLATLQRLGQVLADTHGRRKVVLLVSEGLDYNIEDSSKQTSSGLSTFTSPYASSVMNRMRQAIGAMTRANVAVYSIDPRGLSSAADGIEVGAYPTVPLLGLGPTTFEDELRRAQDTLRVISDDTGGFASISSNDFSDAFARIVRENSSYYVLAYESGNTRRDGRFRAIDVRVKRPGLQVRARKGYTAPSGRDTAENTAAVTASTESSTVLRQLLNNPLTTSGIPLRAFAAPFKGAGNAGSVVFGIEADARDFKFRKEGELYATRLEAAVVPVDQQGKFLNGDRQVIDLRLKQETYDAVRANGLRVIFRLNLPKGRYQLRGAAHEVGSGAAGSVHYDVQIPDFATEPLSLSGLVLTSSRAAAIATPKPDPELAAMLQKHPPTGLREFTSAETVAVAFALYHDARNPVGDVDITVTVLGADGRARFNSALHASSEELREASNGYGYVTGIPLARMPAGAYVLRVEAKSRMTPPHTALREVPFRIRD